MKLICHFCQAKHLALEITSNDMDSFSVCCHKGKIHALHLFKELFAGLNLNDNFEKLF